LLPALATFRAGGNRADRATTGVLLARAYATRLSGDHAANGDEALGYADLAVEDFVALGRIREAAGALVTLGNAWDVESSDDARAMTELGSLLFEAARWADAAAAYERAIAAGEAELREADTPQGRRVTVARLGAAFPEWAYALVQLDRPQDAVRALEAGKQRL